MVGSLGTKGSGVIAGIDGKDGITGIDGSCIKCSCFESWKNIVCVNMSLKIGVDKRGPYIGIKFTIRINCRKVVSKDKMILRRNVPCIWIQHKMDIKGMNFT